MMSKQMSYDHIQALRKFRESLKECKEDALSKLNFVTMQSDKRISKQNKAILREVENLLREIKL